MKRKWMKNKLIKSFIVLLGPIVFLAIVFLIPINDLQDSAKVVLGSAIWMAIWWIFEIVPISVTALLPIVLFPLFKGLDIHQTTAAYGHKYIFLYIGGFILAIAIEKWGLHKRIALNIIKMIGTNVSSIILGFMFATAFLSMWISNTATAVMMLPIGMAIISQLKNNSKTKVNEHDQFGKALMLAIAYSATIGGMATLIGTPPNLVFAGIVEELYNYEISFYQWSSFALPISLVLLLICWLYLTRVAFQLKHQAFPGGIQEINRLYNKLGQIKTEEIIVLTIFSTTAVLWVSSAFIKKMVPSFDDSIVAIIAAISLFLIPSKKDKNNRLITWDEAVKIPWGILLLFGGGIALAEGFRSTGLANWIGDQLTLLENLPLFLLILILIAAVNLLTEITSNLATTAMLLPVLAPMALSLDVHPFLLMVSATLAASCAFMLPVATPPNAVVFGSGYLRISDMAKHGIYMNTFSILFITLLVFFLLPIAWNIDIGSFPDIFKN